MQTEKVASVLSKIFAPDALAAIPEGEQGYDPKIASKVAPNLSLIKPGDLILTRTSSTLYNVLRAFTSEPYDHIAVVLNNKLVLHIGPGRIRTLSLVRLLEPQRSPLVLRPILSSNEKQQFLNKCWSMIGEKYDLVRVFDFVLRLILLNWTPIQIPFKKIRVNITNINDINDDIFTSQNIKNRQWVCSDAIMHKLIKVNNKYKQYLINDSNSNKKLKQIMFNNLGSLTIKDFITMAQNTNNLFQIIQLPLISSDCKSNTNILTTLQQLINIFTELTLAQKILLITLILYLLNHLFPFKNTKHKPHKTHLNIQSNL
eukprot:49213_1